MPSTNGGFSIAMFDYRRLISGNNGWYYHFEMTYNILLSKDLLMGSGIFKNYIRDKSGGLWSRSISEYIQVQWTCSRLWVVDCFHVLEMILTPATIFQSRQPFLARLGQVREASGLFFLLPIGVKTRLGSLWKFSPSHVVGILVSVFFCYNFGHA